MSKEKSLIALFPASLRGEGEQMLTLYGELEEIPPQGGQTHYLKTT